MGPAAACIGVAAAAGSGGTATSTLAFFRPQSRDTHVTMSAVLELNRPSAAQQQLPPLTDEQTLTRKHHDFFFPLSSHLKLVAKSRPNGNSLGSCLVLFVLYQHVTNSHRHCDKAESNSLGVGWSLCSYISRKFPGDASCC